MLIVFILQDNVILLHLESLKEELVFDDLSYVLKHMQDIFFLFSIENIKSNCSIVFLNFFPIIFFWWKISSFSVIFVYTGLIFIILWGSFLVSSCFNDTVTLRLLKAFILFIGGIYCCFLFFIQLGESIYDFFFDYKWA